MADIQIIKPGTDVVVNDIPARIAGVKIGTALKPEYLLSWWDGRQFYTAWFDDDEFQLMSDREGQMAVIGFTHVSI